MKEKEILPFVFDIEASTLCNLNCIMCPRDSITRSKGIMTKETLKEVTNKIIDYSKKFPKLKLRIWFSGMGEPLLNKNIFPFIKKLKQKNMWVAIDTNGILLTKETPNKLIKAGIDLINISLNAATKGIYEKIQGKDSYNLILNNIKTIPKNKLQISMILTKLNEHEKELFREMWIKKGIKNITLPCHSRGGFIIKKNLYKFTPLKNNECQIFAKYNFTAWNGDILPCVHNIIGERSILNIYNGDYIKVLEKKREIFKKDHFYSMCKNCDDPNRWNLNKKYDRFGNFL